MTAGERLRNIRKEKGLTQKELGKLLGISPQMIAQYELGKRNPKYETLGKIAMALNVPISDLIADNEKRDVYAVPPGKIRIGVDDDGKGGITVDPIEFQRVFNGVVQQCCPNPVSNLLTEFYKLTPLGQNLAIKQVKMLTKIPEYQAPPNPAYPGPKYEYANTSNSSSSPHPCPAPAQDERKMK